MNIDEIRENCVPHVSLSMTQTVGGYAVRGTIHWTKDGQQVATQQDEAVATQSVQLAMYAARYFEYGTFDVDEADRRAKGAELEERETASGEPAPGWAEPITNRDAYEEATRARYRPKGFA